MLRATALLYESSYSLIRMRPYMLIALLCIRLVDIDIDNHGVRKTGFGHVNENLVFMEYCICVCFNFCCGCFNLFCNVWVRVYVGFIMCGCVYVWVL
jgi:hypothetical protein